MVWGMTPQSERDWPAEWWGQNGIGDSIGAVGRWLPDWLVVLLPLGGMQPLPAVPDSGVAHTLGGQSLCQRGKRIEGLELAWEKQLGRGDRLAESPPSPAGAAVVAVGPELGGLSGGEEGLPGWGVDSTGLGWDGGKGTEGALFLGMDNWGVPGAARVRYRAVARSAASSERLSVGSFAVLRP